MRKRYYYETTTAKTVDDMRAVLTQSTGVTDRRTDGVIECRIIIIIIIIPGRCLWCCHRYTVTARVHPVHLTNIAYMVARWLIGSVSQIRGSIPRQVAAV